MPLELQHIQYLNDLYKLRVTEMNGLRIKMRSMKRTQKQLEQNCSTSLKTASTVSLRILLSCTLLGGTLWEERKTIRLTSYQNICSLRELLVSTRFLFVLTSLLSKCEFIRGLVAPVFEEMQGRGRLIAKPLLGAYDVIT